MKIGDRVTIEGVELVAVESEMMCSGCFFIGQSSTECKNIDCSNIILKEVEK